MSKEISIKLSDAQADALAEEAKAMGLKFFDHCRNKLLAGTTVPASEQRSYGRGPVAKVLPALERENARATAAAQENDRLDRLEAMMLEMGRAIQNLAHPAAVYEQAAPDLDPDVMVDTNDMVSRALDDAERSGLTAVDRGPPQASGSVRHVGTRRPSPFSVGSQPRHLSQAFGE